MKHTGGLVMWYPFVSLVVQYYKPTFVQVNHTFTFHFIILAFSVFAVQVLIEGIFLPLLDVKVESILSRLATLYANLWYLKCLLSENKTMLLFEVQMSSAGLTSITGIWSDSRAQSRPAMVCRHVALMRAVSNQRRLYFLKVMPDIPSVRLSGCGVLLTSPSSVSHVWRWLY